MDDLRLNFELNEIENFADKIEDSLRQTKSDMIQLSKRIYNLRFLVQNASKDNQLRERETRSPSDE